MKIAAVFIVLLLVLLPVMSLAMPGDGSVRGRLLTFASYSLSLTSLLLCLFTIIASIYTLTSDLKEKQIYTVITKPIRRQQLLVGKLLGVIIVDLILLIVFSAIIYAITIYLPRFFKAEGNELAAINNEFFTARTILYPEEPDVTKEAIEAYEKLEKTGQLPKGITRKQALARLIEDQKKWKRAVTPAKQMIWEFNDIKPLDPSQSLFVKFKYSRRFIGRACRQTQPDCLQKRWLTCCLHPLS